MAIIRAAEGFTYELMVKLFDSNDVEVKLLAGQGLTVFAYNSKTNQHDILCACERNQKLSYAKLDEIMNRKHQIHRSKAAFQVCIIYIFYKLVLRHKMQMQTQQRTPLSNHETRNETNVSSAYS